MSSNVDVVIVGGGAAGVGAARRLAQTSLSTVLLEADVRLGGRAWTHEIGGMDLDMGCGWLHSAEHNAWARIAEAAGVRIDQSPAAWGVQYRGLGFSEAEQLEARTALSDWGRRLAVSPPLGDRASDALDPASKWNTYIRSIVGFISGAAPESMSAADFALYDQASTETNWRVPIGYGALITRSFPAGVALRLATPVESIELDERGARVSTPAGAIRARAVLLTVSSTVLAGETIKLPAALAAWREAASALPLGLNEKFFLEIVGDAPFETETQVIGNPHELTTGAYYLRPMGRPVVEAFFGGEGARVVEENGAAAGFAYALDQLSALFGSQARRALRPLFASSWNRSIRVGGAYSYAIPGQANARKTLAQPFDARVFFAGEATSPEDFSTAHGAHDSGVRAANEIVDALRGLSAA